jgi:hypothetical protein
MKRITLFLICIMFILLTTSCVAADNSAIQTDNEPDIPSDIEVVNVQADRLILDDLQQVEDYSTIIVEAVARKDLGQKVETSYDYGFKKDVPNGGFTRWEIEVTKVYKGDVKAGDKLFLFQEY